MKFEGNKKNKIFIAENLCENAVSATLATWARPRLISHSDPETLEVSCTLPLRVQNYCMSRARIDGLVQACSISIVFAMEILQSCTKPSV